MSEYDEAAKRLRQEARERLQKLLSEEEHEDNFPVILTAYQVSKCAAIVDIAAKGDPTWAPSASTATAFLHASALEAKGMGVSPSAADLWAELEPLPWPLKQRPNDGRSES